MNEARYVVFRLDDERFGLPVGKVTRILNGQAGHSGPDDAFVGWAEVERTTVPVLDTRFLFGFKPRLGVSRLVVVGTAFGAVALKVDSVEGIVDFTEDEIDRSAVSDEGDEEKFVIGLARQGDELVALLEADKVVPPDLMRKLRHEPAAA